MNLNRLCRQGDFEQLHGTLAQLYPGQTISLHRGYWAQAMLFHALVTMGIGKRKGARMLGVGCGTEVLPFALTRFGEVHATDLYLDPGAWSRVAVSSMLGNPAQHAPAGLAWEPQRLIVQHMDGRALRYPEASFDAVFSNSAIEHFGTLDEIAQAAQEIGRVLKPGGVAAITTEFKLNDQAGDGWPGVVVFDATRLRETILEPSGLEPVDRLALDAAEVLGGPPPVDLAAEVLAQHEGRPGQLPHLTLGYRGYVFTFVHLALRKPT